MNGMKRIIAKIDRMKRPQVEPESPHAHDQ